MEKASNDAVGMTMNIYHQGLHSYNKGKIVLKHSCIMNLYDLDYCIPAREKVNDKQLLTMSPFARVLVENILW